MILDAGTAGAFDSAFMARVGTALIAVGATLVPVVPWLFRTYWPERSRSRSSWAPGDLLWLALVYVLVTQALAAAFSLRPGEPAELSVEAKLLASALILAVVGVVAAFLGRGAGGLGAFGLARGRDARAAVLGALAWVALTPLLLGLATVWPWMVERLGERFQPQAWGEWIAGVLDPRARVLVAVMAALVIPVLEETLFRGVVQPTLVDALGPLGGIVTTAALFAALHDPGAYLPILGLAVLLGWVAHRTQRLSAAIAIHVLHNGVQVAYLFSSGITIQAA